jgi:hypothetical protein
LYSLRRALSRLDVVGLKAKMCRDRLQCIMRGFRIDLPSFAGLRLIFGPSRSYQPDWHGCLAPFLMDCRCVLTSIVGHRPYWVEPFDPYFWLMRVRYIKTR